MCAAAPTGAPQSGLHGLSGIKVHDDDVLDPAKLRRPGKRLTSPERWEVNQLIKSGVLSVSEYPTFDEEGQVGSCHSPVPIQLLSCVHLIFKESLKHIGSR